MPFRRLFIGMADLAQERFTERVSNELEREGQAVLVEPTRNRECGSAIEIKRDGESLQGIVAFFHRAI